MFRFKFVIGLTVLLNLFAVSSYAYRPFGTEDAGVAGRGVVQLEASWDYLRWADGKIEKNYLLVPILGVTDQLELSAEIPYLFHENTDQTLSRGVGDINLVIKDLLIAESDQRAAFAIKGVVKLDNGDFNQGLGSGDKDYSLYAVASKTFQHLIIHSHLGYTWLGKGQNANLRDIVLFALGFDYGATDQLHIITEINGNRHPDSTATADPRVWLLGLTYKLSDKLVLDAGSRWGLSPASPDWDATIGVSATL